MKRTPIYTAAFALVTTALMSPNYASTKTDDSRVPDVDNNVEFPSSPSRWRIVKHTFRVHIPQNNKALSQIIIDVPSTVAVSNDIVVSDENGQKINTNVSVNGRRIIVNFPETVIANTKLLIEFNKVKQPVNGPASVYSLSAKAVGSDVEIPVGLAQFSTFSSINSDNKH
ncbi:DUF2808 domain-containing protein [Mastigocladopsis repens]|uniref:DUF2808 domain-containing protein n=1 Tax=Mastigocladopsis repens TaxID=221287 RepID=UPI0003169BA0|nr:DUF2808 domain-containing protein [Mastigocladopsis repens]